ncbi:MAG TPA: DUF934 domain-containing protein [Pseudomonadales bacterium]|nr:DUF934 domain-containing protein [Pseudomonadales bacterium]
MADFINTSLRIIKDGKVTSDTWRIVARSETTLPDGSMLVLPLTLWEKYQSDLAGRTDIGIWFDSDEQPTDEIATALRSLPLVAIQFPVFTDGRGFSIARLLRERFGYQGELRAFGYVLRDQLCFLKRCGFNSFSLQEHADVEAALASLDDFTEYYQTSVDQPQPLFRRA